MKDNKTREEVVEAPLRVPSPKRFDEPEICTICKGACVVKKGFLDEPCEECEGEGVVWKY